MRETLWRSKLVKLFKQRRPDDFIWAHDAHFKSGFPDLTIIANGKTFWIELKRIKTVNQNPIEKLAATQNETLKRMRRATDGNPHHTPSIYVLGRSDDTGTVRLEEFGEMPQFIIWNDGDFHRNIWATTFPL